MKSNNPFYEGEPIVRPPAAGVMLNELPQERELKETPLPKDFTPDSLMDNKTILDRDFPVE